MSKRHVNLYYLQCENDYTEMLENLKDFKDLLNENKITQEEYVDYVRQLELVKSNYERIAYIMFELNKPNRKNKEEDDIAKSWYKALKFSSKEAILNENKDVLSHIKELIKKLDSHGLSPVNKQNESFNNNNTKLPLVNTGVKFVPKKYRNRR